MPAPTDIPSIKGTDLEGNEIERHSSADEPFSALAFKIMADPFVGKLEFFRVYSGKCKAGSYVLNATKDKNCLLYTSVTMEVLILQCSLTRTRRLLFTRISLYTVQ